MLKWKAPFPTPRIITFILVTFRGKSVIFFLLYADLLKEILIALADLQILDLAPSLLFFFFSFPFFPPLLFSPTPSWHWWKLSLDPAKDRACPWPSSLSLWFNHHARGVLSSQPNLYPCLSFSPPCFHSLWGSMKGKWGGKTNVSQDQKEGWRGQRLDMMSSMRTMAGRAEGSSHVGDFGCLCVWSCF